MNKVIIIPLAKLDISDAAIWYNSRQEGLGKRFIYEVRSKVLFIRKNPLASEVKYDNTRCAILDIFPYMIHYNMDESNNTVIIVAVFHTSLNPKKWQIR